MTTDERLEACERELARTKRRYRWLSGAMAIAATVWVMGDNAWRPAYVEAQGQEAAAKEVRAQRFVVVDNNGEQRATLGVSETGPVLELSDDAGVPRAVLNVGPAGALLYLNDDNGEERAAFGSDAETLGPVLRLRGATHEQTAVLHVSFGPALTLTDRNGVRRAELDATPLGPTLKLLDESGQLGAMMLTGWGGSAIRLASEEGDARLSVEKGLPGPRLYLSDENGARAVLGSGTTETPDGKKTIYPASSLRLFGPNGRLTWQAP